MLTSRDIITLKSYVQDGIFEFEDSIEEKHKWNNEDITRFQEEVKYLENLLSKLEAIKN